MCCVFCSKLLKLLWRKLRLVTCNNTTSCITLTFLVVWRLVEAAAAVKLCRCFRKVVLFPVSFCMWLQMSDKGCCQKVTCSSSPSVAADYILATASLPDCRTHNQHVHHHSHRWENSLSCLWWLEVLKYLFLLNCWLFAWWYWRCPYWNVAFF